MWGPVHWNSKPKSNLLYSTMLRGEILQKLVFEVMQLVYIYAPNCTYCIRILIKKRMISCYMNNAATKGYTQVLKAKFTVSYRSCRLENCIHNKTPQLLWGILFFTPWFTVYTTDHILCSADTLWYQIIFNSRQLPLWLALKYLDNLLRSWLDAFQILRKNTLLVRSSLLQQFEVDTIKKRKEVTKSAKSEVKWLA